MHSKIVVACALLAVLLSLPACGDDPAPEPQPAASTESEARTGTTAGVAWAVMPIETGTAFDLDATSYWVPGAKDIAQALERVGAYVATQSGVDDRAAGVAQRLAEYCCQTIGMEEKGRRRLYLSFLHGNFIKGMAQREQSDWRAEPMVVLDGGDLFWNVTYDPKTGAFSDLTINGES